jgi:DNA-directed RNA polymerase specialized sigma subunit
LKTDDSRGNEVVAMIAISVTSGNSFKLVSSIIDIVVKEVALTRQERERLVLDLYYNQGKTYREIAKEATTTTTII